MTILGLGFPTCIRRADHSKDQVMNLILKPWQLLLITLAGWIQQQQQQALDYLRTENPVLKEKPGKKRVLLNDATRRRPAVKAKLLGRESLDALTPLVSPDTRSTCICSPGAIGG